VPHNYLPTAVCFNCSS